ncbi:hypothetical protein WN55_10864 [Dufourea novaeangliae]|uniref:Uncharacterized protein n=1 Tax=Dufourea novaeangliae TaxID=178035 RepID=A0A154PA45_DUFNO|nr:hypothetical protein WN55_10864 [Dufourea novaeangliae]
MGDNSCIAEISVVVCLIACPRKQACTSMFRGYVSHENTLFTVPHRCRHSVLAPFSSPPPLIVHAQDSFLRTAQQVSRY